MAKAIVTKKRKTTNKPHGSATDVMKRVEIKTMRMMSAHVSQKQDVLAGGTLQVSYTVRTETRVTPEGDGIAVDAHYALTALQSQATEPVVEIKTTLEVTYACSEADTFPLEAIQEFGQANGVFNTWPYWREYVQSSIARMGLPTLIVPVFRLALPPKPTKKKTTKASVRGSVKPKRKFPKTKSTKIVKRSTRKKA
jgi:hypothetical protein